MILTILLSLWLVIIAWAFSLGSLITQGFGEFELDSLAYLALSTLLWPAAIPLTWAVRLLHHRSRLLAYGCAVVLVPASFLAAGIGGGVGIGGAVGLIVLTSLPAWLILGITVIVQRDRESPAPAA